MVGAGAGGLEAARVAAERGHQVTVLEAPARPAGRSGWPTQNPRRKELIGIVDWRLAELERLGVEIRYDIWAEEDDVLALAPDVVVIATGGLPQNPPLDGGDDLVTSSWDIMAGAVKPAENVLLYDDNGGHPGMGAAELIAEAGAKLELVSPERFFAPEMGGMNHVPYMRAFHEKGVTHHHQHAPAVGAARGQPAGRDARLRTSPRAGAGSGGSTRWWSSTARCRSTISISR